MRSFVFLLLLASTAFAEDESRLLGDIRQLTFAGKRAGEGYYSADGTKMIFQSERDEENPFFQIYVLDLETGDINRVSPGKGKTTCAWIHPKEDKALFASTHGDGEAVEKQRAEIRFRKSGKDRRYSWDYDENYEIYEAGLDGSNLKNLTDTLGYDAEGSYSPDGTKIAFASNRHAYAEELAPEVKERFERKRSYLMDIYIMDADGSNVKRLTDVPGYDGGPFFSADGTKICWRRFSEDGATAEVFTMNVDGSEQKQITRLGAMSWAPFFHPSGEYLVFATNLNGFANFEIYMVDAFGENEPVRVTWTEGFDGLPAFAPDGKSIAWTTNRTPDKKSQIYTATWNDQEARALLGIGRGSPMQGFSPAIAEAELKMHIDHLASDELDGRLTGTEGERRATEYAAMVLGSCLLEPAGDNGTWYQEFEFTAGIDLGKGNQLAAGDDTFEVGADWRPLSFSTVGGIDPTEIVFAGYGMEVPEGKGEDGKEYELYSSYFHLDVKDKWVLMFRYMPEEVTPALRRRYARHSSLRYKALTARQKGARGIIIVSGPNAQVKSELVPLSYDASMAGSGVAAISISNALAGRLLAKGGEERSLKALQDRLDTGEMMAGVSLKGVELGGTIDIRQEKRIGRNVLARLPSGTDRAPVLIGAHIDHLGPKAGTTSRAGKDEEEKIHYGADDNASGVAGVFEIAGYLVDQKRSGKLKMKRDAIFALWSGEELGLLGSAHYVRKLAEEVAGSADAKLTGKLSAALNMDMIGRLQKNAVLQGVGSSDYWQGAIERRNAPVGLPILTQEDTYLSTDATSFYLKGVPILNAFTGAHEDYHTPRDTPDKIDLAGTQKITRFMGLVMRGLLASDEEPEFKEMTRPEKQGARAGLRAYLGTIPDYSQGKIEGLKLSGVTKGAPADKAGIVAGDIIVKLAGKGVKNIYDYTYVIEALKIGKEVDVEVMRGEERLKLRITPGSRD